ncbi:hypothetical protein [Streptomyces sp. NPDC050504]|uniref:hypothetical protein n=1 Tax=Streptomyces sp. NPDC050504 TaxID=3365618 RepID=UPI00379CBDA2
MKKALAAAGTVALITAGTVGCNPTEKLTAGMKVQKAFDRLKDEKAVSAAVGFGAKPEDLLKLMRKDDKDATLAQAQLVTDLRISIAASADKPLSEVTSENLKDSKVSASFSIGKKDSDGLLEVRSIGEKTYLRADLKGVGTLVDSVSPDAGAKKDIDEMLNGINSAELPSSLASVKAAIEGKWVEIDLKSFEEFAKSQGADLGAEAGLPTSSLDAKTQKEFIDAVSKAIGDNAEAKDSGSEDGADVVTVTVPAQKTAKDLVKALKPLESKIPELKELNKADPSKAPAKDIAIDVHVKKGQVAKLSLDLSQFDEKNSTGGVKLPLVIEIKSDADKVEAPADATKLQPQDIMGAVAFMMGGAGGAEGMDESGFDDSDLGA